MYDSLVRDTGNAAAAVVDERPSIDRPNTDRRRAHRGVIADGLGKRFDDVWALRSLDLDVAPGTVLGLLGRHGAGKTTAIRVLTTMSPPTEGRAMVAGHDVVDAAALVRARIGVASRQATVDGLLDARLNLEMIARLHQVPKAVARRRADELVERFGLTDVGDGLVGRLPGGMRRRLDLAACLVTEPEVLFLDEPTIGLDPRSREDVWQLLRDLVADGTTLVLTTRDLEEANRLADDIVVLDHGRTVAHDSPAALTARVGDHRIDVVLAGDGQLGLATAVLSAHASGGVGVDRAARTVTASTDGGVGVVELLHALDDAGVDVRDIARRRATLDDVLLASTSP